MAGSSIKPWFVLAGGGTGGHLYPGLAVAECVRNIQRNFEVAVFGTTRPIDAQLTAARGYELIAQSVQPFSGSPMKWPRFFKGWRASVKAARQRFEERPPAVVLGLGGYASAPPMVAAVKLGIPTAIFNPDAVPGRANRRMARIVDRVFTQWEETQNYFTRAKMVRCLGCPIRPSFAGVKKDEAKRALKLSVDKKTLLITGASQGARSINAAVMELMDLWKVAKDWQIIHLTGAPDLDMCRTKYKENQVDARTLAFTEHMPLCMAAADLVISRAGASTLGEITAMGLPSILLPYPYDRKKHQTSNAMALVSRNAAELIDDGGDPMQNAKRMRDVLRDVMKSDERRRRMGRAAAAMGRTDAAQAMAEELLEMAAARA